MCRDILYDSGLKSLGMLTACIFIWMFCLISVCRTPLSTSWFCSVWQFGHTFLRHQKRHHRIAINVDVMSRCDVTRRRVFASMKNDVTNASNLWLTVDFNSCRRLYTTYRIPSNYCTRCWEKFWSLWNA